MGDPEAPSREVLVALIIQKYGGSPVADAEAIKRVVRRVMETKRRGHNVIVVVFIMGDTTDDLPDLATQVMAHAPGCETDMLLSAGERISVSLLTMAVNELGEAALSFTGQQVGVHTDDHFGKAAIVSMMPEHIARSISEGNVAVVVGFQGVNKHDDITTFGRGDLDTTAVVLAVSLQADACEIYTDVDGLFTTDPRIAPTARYIHTIDSEFTLEMAAYGTKTLHLRTVEFTRRYRVSLHVRSSFSGKDGIWIPNITANPVLQGIIPESALIYYCQEEAVEGPVISGIAHDRSQGKLTLVGVPGKPGSAAHIFGIIAEAGVNIDMTMQNVFVV